jgi:phosphatidylserine decarboxylase
MTEPVPAVSPDLPSPPWRATLALLERLPQAALSRSFGRLADLGVPRPLRRIVLGTFARAVGIDVGEAERPLDEYVSINDFFVRRLRPGLRAWPDDPDTAASPADGIAGQHGIITGGRLIQAKGRDYTAADLLVDPDDAHRFEGGAFFTIYLSPRHYHRLHAPCGGTIPFARYVPGALLPVNAAAVVHIAGLFPRNERVICMIDAPIGRCAVVAIGAYNVGRISTSFDEAWGGGGRAVSNRGTPAETRRYDPPLPVAQGAEIMAFHLGSTIVLLFEPGLRLAAPLPGTELRLGTVIARRAHTR